MQLQPRPVEQHMDAHPGTGALGKQGGKLLRDVPVPVDEALQRDAVSRAGDCRQHCREDFVPVLQGAHAIAVNERGTEKLAQGTVELRIAHPVGKFDPMADLFLVRNEVAREQGPDGPPPPCLHPGE